MQARMASSSRPTVLTKYPRAQKFWPTKLRFLSPYTRARWIALLPLKPDHVRHRVLRRDRQHHMNVVRHQMPFLDLRFLLRRELVEHLAQMAAQLLIQRLPAALRNENDVNLQSQVVWLKAWYSSIGGGPCMRLAAQGWKSAGGPPETSNCYCTPAEPGRGSR